ncbi:MAG: SAM-dependent methyltransferase [Micropepsaceae bacterium]
MADEFKVAAIGRVRSGRNEAIDDGWDAIPVRIELDPDQFTPEALMSLDQFSHAEIVYLFDRVQDDQIERGARHPRGRTDWPRAGIFAQRGKNRPNRIGVTVAEIVKVEGLTLTLKGLDAIEGTPVLDIKPVLSGFLPRGPVREPEWAREIMAAYWG